jgi:TRAP-type C4-dicarboxylate transport system permease small subunit
VILRLLIKIDDFIEKIMRLVLPTLITLVAILMTLQTILRYILHMPLYSIEELILIPSIWLYFLGSIEASRKESHMNARLLEIYFKSPRHIAIIRSLSAFWGTIISIWLSYWSYDLLRYSLRLKKESLILGYRLTVIECMPFICFGLISIYMIFEFWRYAKKVAATSINGGEN